jgi:hypothetical protein
MIIKKKLSSNDLAHFKIRERGRLTFGVIPLDIKEIFLFEVSKHCNEHTY